MLPLILFVNLENPYMVLNSLLDNGLVNLRLNCLIDFVQSKNDYSLFIKKTPTSLTIVVVYVDDIIISGNHLPSIQSIKSHLHTIFSIKDLGKLHYFLGLEVSYLPDGIVLSQKKFTTDHLKDSGLPTFKKVVTPLPINFKLQSSDSPLFSDTTKYRSLVGKLNFLTNTRPDLSFTVQALSQYMQSPTELHYQALTHTHLIT